MIIMKIAITTLASAAIMATTAGPAMACSHPVQKPAVHQHVAQPKHVKLVVQKKDCDHKVAVTPKPTPKPTPKTVVKNKDCDHNVVTTPKPTPTPIPVETGKGQVLSAASTEAAQPLPTKLPDTGAGLSALIGLPTLALAGRAYLRSRLS
jgi:outer membrane biosynthesis protein TonB